MDQRSLVIAGAGNADGWELLIEDLQPRWRSVALAFLVEKGARSGSRATVETYGRQLCRYLGSVGTPEAAQPLDVLRFVHAPTAGGRPSPATASLRLAVVFGFYDFARRMRLLDANPATAIQRPRVVPPPPRGLTTDEVHRLLGAIPDNRLGSLHRAMVVTGLLTGRRRSELVELRVAADDGVVLGCTTRVKGGDTWTASLPPPATALVREASQRSDRRLEVGSRLFPTSGASFYAWLRRYGAAAGVADLSPHVLRHTAARLRRETGCSVEEISRFLGHSNIATTSIYLQRLAGRVDDGWLPVATLLRMGADGRAD